MSFDSDDSDIVYELIWNELMQSPFRSVELDPSAIPSTDSRFDAYSVPNVHPALTSIPQNSFTPLSPPSSPPLWPSSNHIGGTWHPAHTDLLGLDGTASPPYFRTPPVSPPSVTEPLPSPAVVQTEVAITSHSSVSSLETALNAHASGSVLPTEAALVLARSTPFDDYTDGGIASNLAALAMLERITHIGEPWLQVFFHSWNIVYHASHTHQPVQNLISLANHALHDAYARWDVTHPNEPLEPEFMIIDGRHLTAERRFHTNSNRIMEFESKFKAILRLARQANMNRLLECTRAVLVLTQVIPYLPEPYPDIRTLGSTTTTSRIYTAREKDYFYVLASWVPGSGSPIWHRIVDGRIQWFANPSVRDFLNHILFNDEFCLYSLGARHARRDVAGHIASWGPATELDNTSVLALLAKLLASLSVGILYDVVEGIRWNTIKDISDTHHNSLINDVAKQTFELLHHLDTINVGQSSSPRDEDTVQTDGHVALQGLKAFLGFTP